MPAKRPVKIRVTCPHCGKGQLEPPAAISTNCRKCGQDFRVQEVLQPAPKATRAKPRQRKVVCFECGTELSVALNAESTMCKRCSSYIDLHDYRINSAVSKNFKTTGEFVIEAKGNVFNTQAVVGDAVIKGRFLGRLDARGSLTIHSGARIKGTFTAHRLVIPEESEFQWPEPIEIGSAEIAGELAAPLHGRETVHLRSTARLFGDVKAANLVVEEGAVVVGSMRINAPKPARASTRTRRKAG